MGDVIFGPCKLSVPCMDDKRADCRRFLAELYSLRPELGDASAFAQLADAAAAAIVWLSDVAKQRFLSGLAPAAAWCPGGDLSMVTSAAPLAAFVQLASPMVVQRMLGALACAHEALAVVGKVDQEKQDGLETCANVAAIQTARVAELEDALAAAQRERDAALAVIDDLRRDRE